MLVSLRRQKCCYYVSMRRTLIHREMFGINLCNCSVNPLTFSINLYHLGMLGSQHLPPCSLLDGLSFITNVWLPFYYRNFYNTDLLTWPFAFRCHLFSSSSDFFHFRVSILSNLTHSIYIRQSNIENLFETGIYFLD